MKHTLLDIEAELSCADALLQAEPIQLARVRQHIKAARTQLLTLAEQLEEGGVCDPTQN